MRPALRWALGLTVLASVLLVLRDEPAPRSARATAPKPERAPDPALSRAVPAGHGMQALPAELTALDIEPARRDPFSPAPPPAPPAAAVQRVSQAPPPAPPPAPPQAPPPVWRFWGSMQTPEGQRLLMLARGEQVQAVQVGTQLDDGYMVEAIGPQSLRLVYTPLGKVVELPLPAPGN